MTTTAKVISWILRLTAAGIFIQTLYFKFTGAPESIYIFKTTDMEPWGRYLSGTGELLAAVLMLIPSTVWVGASIGLGIIAGAIFFHLTKLGIVVLDDGGLLFGLAVTEAVCCSAILILHRKEIPFLKFV